jgi:UDP-N-acetylmuramoyl-L-alanyl-D-glutamate--2,6-diaminopimelate ligase
MGSIAEEHCEHIILTNEDPYDEDPSKIIDDIAGGIKNKKPEKILDRREALARAFKLANPGDVVIITGKGTDPYIMEANNKKTPWDDATVAREELAKLKHK